MVCAMQLVTEVLQIVAWVASRGGRHHGELLLFFFSFLQALRKHFRVVESEVEINIRTTSIISCFYQLRTWQEKRTVRNTCTRYI
jgi:hypothetical protein